MVQVSNKVVPFNKKTSIPFPFNTTGPKEFPEPCKYVRVNDPNIFAPWVCVNQRAGQDKMSCQVLTRDKKTLEAIGSIFIEKLPEMFLTIPKTTVSFIGKFGKRSGKLSFIVAYIVVDKEAVIFSPEAIAAYTDEASIITHDNDIVVYDRYEDIGEVRLVNAVFAPCSISEGVLWCDVRALSIYGSAKVRKMDYRNENI